MAEGRSGLFLSFHWSSSSSQFSSGSQGYLEELASLETIHVKNEEHWLASKSSLTLIGKTAHNGRHPDPGPGPGQKEDGGEVASNRLDWPDALL